MKNIWFGLCLLALFNSKVSAQENNDTIAIQKIIHSFDKKIVCRSFEYNSKVR